MNGRRDKRARRHSALFSLTQRVAGRLPVYTFWGGLRLARPPDSPLYCNSQAR